MCFATGQLPWSLCVYPATGGQLGGWRTLKGNRFWSLIWVDCLTVYASLFIGVKSNDNIMSRYGVYSRCLDMDI